MIVKTQTRTLFLIILVLAALASAGCTSISEKNQTAEQIAHVPAESTPAVSVAAYDAGSCTPVTILQSDGSPVTIPCRPERIIVTNSDAAEMLIALGAGDMIVGVTETTKNASYIMNRIPQAQSIGDWQTPNIERMLSLKPDAVISYASSKPKNLDQIRAANITIIYLDCYRLPKLAADARAVGILTGHERDAEEYARLVENTTAIVTNRVATVSADKIPTVYFEGYSEYTAAGTGSGSDELLTMAGGKNIASDLSSSSPKVSAEWVVSQKPANIMKVISSKETRPFAQVARAMADRTGWGTLPAVQQERIFLFSNSVEFGPKAYIGLAYTAKVLHPDLFADLDPAALLDDYAGRYLAGSNTTQPVYPDIR